MPKGTPGRATCSVDGCGGLVKARGYCNTHYLRWWRTGDPLCPLRGDLTELERFWAKVDQSGGPDTCWPWTGARVAAGYGAFFIDRGGPRWVHEGAHRYAYGVSVGPIPEGLVIDHLCRNPPCCNPSHLEPVTQRVNALRGVNSPSAMNAVKTHCKNGHPFDEANTFVQKSGSRECRICSGELRRRWRAEHQ